MLTYIDFFCGAGGSSSGAVTPPVAEILISALAEAITGSLLDRQEVAR
ncbi:hypothetical protein [Streptomyces abikoensis]|nr:hypothetical protein [Streptomyces abikoensis]GGP55429.1 hypothetical protein GCM10010214_30760 [Streptomyces abikoensis]